jgi:hypothetical protein
MSQTLDTNALDSATMIILELSNLLEPFLPNVVFIGSLAPWFLLSEGYLSRPLEEGEHLPAVPTGPQSSNDIEISLALDLPDPNVYTAITQALFGYQETAPKSGKFSRPHKQKSKVIIELIPLVEAGAELPSMPPTMNRTGTEILLQQSSLQPIKGFDFQGKPKTSSLIVAKLSTFVLLRAYLFSQKKETKHITEICYALEFLLNGPIRAADELKPFMQSLWVRDGIQRLRSFFVDADADGPAAYAKEHGISMVAAVKFRKAQAFDLVKKFLKRFDGAVEGM